MLPLYYDDVYMYLERFAVDLKYECDTTGTSDSLETSLRVILML